MRLVIEIDVQDDYIDADDRTGLTIAGYERLVEAVMRVGDLVDIRIGDDGG